MAGSLFRCGYAVTQLSGYAVVRLCLVHILIRLLLHLGLEHHVLDLHESRGIAALALSNSS